MSEIVPKGPTLKTGRQVEVPATTGGTPSTTGDNLSLGKTRADFRAEEFTRAIKQHGKRLIWRKAMLCPCQNAETSQSALDCPFCNAEGYVYVQPQHIQAHMAAFDGKTSVYEKFGLFQEGSSMVTSLPEHRLGFHDSLELEDARAPFNELLTRGDRRGLRSALPANVDAARYRVLSVAAMLWMRSPTELVPLEERIDFRITAEGWIRWLNADIPEGALVSIHYDYAPVFLVVSHPHVIRIDESGRRTTPSNPRVVALPNQAMAKLDFLVSAARTPSLQNTYSVPGPSGVGPGD